MAEFRHVDLGRVMQTAEALKGARRQAVTDQLRDRYLGVQTQNAEQAGAIAQDENRRQNAEAAAKTRALDAKRAYHVSDAIFRSDNPREAVQNIAPDFVQQFEAKNGAGSFAAIPDAQIKQLFGSMRERSMVEAGIQPKFSNPEPGQQNGQDVFFQTDEQGNPRVLPGITPRPQKKGPGMSVLMPDGTEIKMGEDGVPNYGGVGLTKPNQNELQKAFINAQGNAYALREQIAKYNPQFSTMGGRLKAGIANMKEQAGIANAPQQQQFLSNFTTWKADTASLLSQYLNQLSGAAISPHEETRLKAGFPNAEDGPSEYLAKAQATMRRFSLAQARAAYLLSNPAQSMDSVSLDNMSNIIASEANRIAESLKRGGMDEEAAKQKAIADTRVRFGLDANGQ